MRDSSNPLRNYFWISIFLLVSTLFDFVFRIISDNELFTSVWQPIQKTIGLIGIGMFLYFYIQKSLHAWHALAITFACMLPFFFLLPLPDSSSLSRAKLLIVLVVLWVLAMVDLLVRYRKYSRYLGKQFLFVSIKTTRYSALLKRIFEEYDENVEIYIEGNRYSEKDIPKLLEWWCKNEIIKRTVDFSLYRDGVGIFGFHDTPDDFWAAISERCFVEQLAREKIIRCRICS